jgi:hypothetical protein
MSLADFIATLTPEARRRLAPLLERARKIADQVADEYATPDDEPGGDGPKLWCPILKIQCPGPVTTIPDKAPGDPLTSGVTGEVESNHQGSKTRRKADLKENKTGRPPFDKAQGLRRSRARARVVGPARRRTAVNRRGYGAASAGGESQEQKEAEL